MLYDPENSHEPDDDGPLNSSQGPARAGRTDGGPQTDPPLTGGEHEAGKDPEAARESDTDSVPATASEPKTDTARSTRETDNPPPFRKKTPPTGATPSCAPVVPPAESPAAESPAAEGIAADGPPPPPGQKRDIEPPVPPVVGPPTDQPADESDKRVAGYLHWLLLPRVFHQLTGFLISTCFHMGLLIALSLMVAWFARPMRTGTRPLLVVSPPQEEPALVVSNLPMTTVAPPTTQLADSVQRAMTPDAPAVEAPFAKPSPANAAPSNARPDDLPMRHLLQRTSAPVGGGFRGRQADSRAQLLAIRGGTPESENAVAMALAWLAAHQAEDGSWRFDHHLGPCQGHCRHPGTSGSTTGATGLALLPFLGAGQTPRHGDYREVVRKGLYYLGSRMIVTPQGGDLQEGTMYAHGIATIALCEAYAMTQDESLKGQAQSAIDFICAAQHFEGGWRYFPKQPGDTTVFGWQLMALKSADMAKLDVPSPVITLANRYLDSVQTAGGAQYGYQDRKKKPTPTAVGLLSRMYLGWRRNDERLARGVKYLETLKPSATDVYFNYYATQVLSHHNGEGWPKWNEQLREYLIRTQGTKGHERGSWFFKDRHGDAGGRLYNTAMSAMILEVYYRHMPLYGHPAIDDELNERSPRRENLQTPREAQRPSNDQSPALSPPPHGIAKLRRSQEHVSVITGPFLFCETTTVRMLPVIDLKGGLVVRGVAGVRSEYQQVRSQLTDDLTPAGICQAFVESFRADTIYVADLDAIAGASPALDIYAQMAATGVRMWIDAGAGDVPRTQLLLEQQHLVDRLVFGLESIDSPARLEQLLAMTDATRSVFSLDLHDGKPLNASPAWRRLDPLQIMQLAVDAGATTAIVLDLAAVGVGMGPGVVDLCRQLRSRWPQLEIVAGGGVRHREDLKTLEAAGCDAVLVASALHSGAMRE